MLNKYKFYQISHIHQPPLIQKQKHAKGKERNEIIDFATSENRKKKNYIT